MGQMTVGLMYGCEAPDLPVTDDDPEPVYDLLQRWEKAAGVKWTDPGAKVRVEYEGGRGLFGVWIAVGGSGEDDAPYFLEQCVRFDQVEKAFKVRIAEAKRLWKRFAAHVAKAEKIKLPAPALWLTPAEVA